VPITSECSQTKTASTNKTNKSAQIGDEMDPRIQRITEQTGGEHTARCHDFFRELNRVVWTSVSMARCADDAGQVAGLGSASAVVPKIDHRVSQRLERIVQVTEAFEAHQQAAEFIFPGEHPLDGPEALLENGRIRSAASGPAWAFCARADSG